MPATSSLSPNAADAILFPSQASYLAVGVRYNRRKRPDPYMALMAFFDESGTHGEESPAVVVGGFVATEANWAAYERDLKHLMSTFGVEVFHARKFRKRRDQFKGWSDSQFLGFGTQFFDLFDKHLRYGIAVAIPWADYKELYRAEKFPVKGRQDSIYGLCFRFCLLALIRFAEEMEHEWPLTVILEDGPTNARDAVRIFNEVKSSVLKPEYRHLLGAIDFGSKDTCLPLASADAMVHTLYQTKAEPKKWQKARATSLDFIPSAAGLRLMPKSRIQLYTGNRNTLADLRRMLDDGIIPSRLTSDNPQS